MKTQVKLIVGSSVCLASIPALALAGVQTSHARRGAAEADVLMTPVPTGGTPGRKNPSAGFAPVTTRVQSAAEIRSTGDGTNLHRWSGGRLRPVYAAESGHWFQNIGVVQQEKPRLRYVTVRSGDSLWSLSRRYHVSLTDLERWNHLSVDSILQIGQRLVMANAGSYEQHGLTGSTATTRIATIAKSAKPRAQVVSLTVHASNPPPQSNSRPSKSPPNSNRTANDSLSGRGESQTGALGQGVFGTHVVDYARKFVGTPYEWGGVSPSGFDCSGFVLYVFAHFGVHLGRTSYQQFEAGESVHRADLLPGDLVFFDTDGPGASHVGIYTGGGDFVSAAGSEVQILSINSGYWADHYVGARRVTH